MKFYPIASSTNYSFYLAYVIVKRNTIFMCFILAVAFYNYGFEFFMMR